MAKRRTPKYTPQHLGTVKMSNELSESESSSPRGKRSVTVVTHLYRGSPAVRSWSKYQETVEGWTLCGINRRIGSADAGDRAESTEDASLVSCPYCHQLMQPSRLPPRRPIPGNDRA